ncbi:MAG: ABC transporter permease [Clostridia bacterium]|nr:ABC transporter permease [Clostridia bacterium]
MTDKDRNELVDEVDSTPADAPYDAEQYSLNDDRRVKVLSPGAMVAKRFFRNRLAMVGLFILIAMFLFSFVGGLISPYDEDQLFYRSKVLKKTYASAKENVDYTLVSAHENALEGAALQGQILDALDKGKNTAVYKTKDKDYHFRFESEGTDFFSIYDDDENTLLGVAYKDVMSFNDPSFTASYAFVYAAIKAYSNGGTSFTPAGEDKVYTLDDGVIALGDEEFGYISRYKIKAALSDVVLTRQFKEQIIEIIEANRTTGEAVLEVETGEEDVTLEYYFTKNPNNGEWDIRQDQESRVYDTYASPSRAHWLGTDGNGMDMLTRLMYGGRVSLMIGFVVEIISTVLGVILGGISGYFGGWIDNLIMRIVDIFYCIPSLPIFIIIGTAMDNMGVPPKIRMLYLMLILGFLGWPSIARLVRGQILSLREQEFMTATEACGISAHRRIFKHLVPNVIPQLIVSCTMGLGSTIITEATLSFLGLGVRFPFASWGNIITDVNNTFVLTNFWFIWIPAGTLLLLTVLAFNILGDGLRDAFDPKMKR